MRKNMRHQELRDWWEFQALYRHLAGLSASNFSNHHSSHSDFSSELCSTSSTTLSKKHKTAHNINKQFPLYYILNENNELNNKRTASSIQSHHLPFIYQYQNCHQQLTPTSLAHKPTSDYAKSTDIAKSTRSINSRASMNNSNVNQQLASQLSNRCKVKQNQPRMSNSRQNQSKRQREWIYLSHYLAICGLNPIYVISGSDDGREPDFTLVFYHDYRLYYVGIELTTLPRLRDRMGDKNLIAKRWYWQSLHQMARLREKEKQGHSTENLIHSYDRFRLPLQTLYMPKTEFANMPSATSMITQHDVDEVMRKKAHKVDAYHTRRPLQELWLLVHTDKYQPDCILTAPDFQLMHQSGFDQIHITRYPSHKVISVEKDDLSISI